MKPFFVIVAATHRGGIGYQGSIPWKLPTDLKHFSELTKSSTKINAVIMGRKTYQSIGRVLPGRINIVVSRTLKEEKDKFIFDDLEKALRFASTQENIDKIFIIGGAELYRRAFQSFYCKTIYFTQILKDIKCDVAIPRIPDTYQIDQIGDVIVENGVPFQFLTYQRKHQEYQYLDMLTDILTTGKQKADRTGTGTLSKFGYTMKFDLTEEFPILTTKKVYWKGIVGELLWFIAGVCDTKELSKQNIKIWDENTSREVLDKLGFTEREIGDLGPSYPHAFRHWGAQYIDCKTPYLGLGFDQLSDVIRLIKKDPNSRRIVMTSWNPTDLSKMALPPCHGIAIQWYIENDRLHCAMYQRSSDSALGSPWNISSYSLLTCLIAHVCNLQPGSLTLFLGDAHIYLNHIEPLKEQLTRTPRQLPKLVLDSKVKDIDEFKMEHITLVGYKPMSSIKMEMSV